MKNEEEKTWGRKEVQGHLFATERRYSLFGASILLDLLNEAAGRQLDQTSPACRTRFVDSALPRL